MLIRIETSLSSAVISNSRRIEREEQPPMVSCGQNTPGSTTRSAFQLYTPDYQEQGRRFLFPPQANERVPLWRMMTTDHLSGYLFHLDIPSCSSKRGTSHARYVRYVCTCTNRCFSRHDQPRDRVRDYWTGESLNFAITAVKLKPVVKLKLRQQCSWYATRDYNL